MLTLTQKSLLKVTDEVLAVKHSHNGKLLSIALMDNTVRIFFTDTLKFFLNVYGHKLPVLCLDMSDDNTLLVTGSADKNVMIWGMDFGDCHRSLFAHSDRVTAVLFQPRTHYFFSAGKDRLIKYWDADKFEQIMTIRGHHKEIWALTMSSNGDFLISGGNDRSLRKWSVKGDDPVFIDEEKEKEMDRLYTQDLDNENPSRPGDIPGSSLQPELQVQKPSRRTQESVTAGERLQDAINLADNERSNLQKHLKKGYLKTSFTKNPHLAGKSPEKWVQFILQSIKASELEEALLVLPCDNALSLFYYLKPMIEKPITLEFSLRCLMVVVRMYTNRIYHDRTLHAQLRELRNIARVELGKLRNQIGFNLAGLRFLKENDFSEEDLI